MKTFSLSINPVLLLQLLEITFENLPAEYSKAIEQYKKLRTKSFFRETLISNWIAIAVPNQQIFRQFNGIHRFSNIRVTTTNNYTTELQIYINNYGIVGISIAENLENLLLNTIDTSDFRIEEPPVSKFYNRPVDLEGLDGFEEIEEYLNYNSNEYIIAGTPYYSIIELSDEKCIAVDERNAVFLINKLTGLTKLLHKRPKEFTDDFKNNRLTWIFD